MPEKSQEALAHSFVAQPSAERVEVDADTEQLLQGLEQIEVFNHSRFIELEKLVRKYQETGEPVSDEDYKEIAVFAREMELFLHSTRELLSKGLGDREAHDLKSYVAAFGTNARLIANEKEFRDSIMLPFQKAWLRDFLGTWAVSSVIMEDLILEYVGEKSTISTEAFRPELSGDVVRVALEYQANMRAETTTAGRVTERVGDLDFLRGKTLQAGPGFMTWWTNIVRNAYKHSKAQKYQFRFAQAYDGSVKSPVMVVSLIDNGIGMPAAYLDPGHPDFIMSEGTTHGNNGTGRGLKNSVKLLISDHTELTAATRYNPQLSTEPSAPWSDTYSNVGVRAFDAEAVENLRSAEVIGFEPSTIFQLRATVKVKEE